MINGKEYIGKHQTKTIEDGYLGSGKHLKRAIAKYGIENFKREVLFVFETESDMNIKESELVTEDYCHRNDTYNICPGGKGGFGYVNALPAMALLRKINGKRTGIKHKERLQTDPQYRQFHLKKFKEKVASKNVRGAGFLGRKHSDETRQKQSRSAPDRSGSKNSQYGTCWVTDGSRNVKIKKETLDSFLNIGYKQGRITKLAC